MSTVGIALAIAFAASPPDQPGMAGSADAPQAPVAATKRTGWWPWGKKEAATDGGGWTLGRWFAPKSDGKSDEMLLVKCRGLIYLDRELSTCSIRVSVERRVATLEGTVSSPVLAEKAERLAKKTEGLKSVSNLLRVGFGARSAPNSGGVQLSDPVPVRMASTPKPLPPTQSEQQRPRQKEPRKQAATPVALLPPVRESVMVSRPQVVVVSPDLPRVTTYTLRRSLPQDRPLVKASAELAERASAPIPSQGNKPASRPRLIVEQTEAPRRLPERVEAPKRDARVDGVLRANAGAIGVDYRLSDKELQLTGVVESSTTLVELMTALASLPGFERVVVDPANVVIRER